MKSLRTMTMAGCVLALAGCGNESLELSTYESEAAAFAQRKADTLYFLDLVAKSPLPYVKLNFADDRHFRFALNRLEAGGRTPENAPELYDGIQEARELALAHRGPSDVEMPSGYSHLIANILQEPSKPDRITTDAFTTTQGGSPKTYIDVVMTNGDTGTLLGEQIVEEETNEGTNLTARTQGDMPTGKGSTGHVIVDSFACSDADGTTKCSVSSVGTHLKKPGKLLAPYDQTLPGVPLDGMITVCLNRSWLYDAYDCEYAMEGTGGNIIFPFKGEMEFDGDITKIKKAWLEMSLANNGGACRPQLDFLSYIKQDVSRPGFITWDIPKASFGKNCFSHQADVNININVQVDINLDGTNISGLGTISSQTDNGNATIPEIQFASSCLAAGTQIRLSDGQLEAVEQLDQTDRVLADTDGLQLSIMDLSLGVEDVPMIRLEDSLGHSLLLTEGHPVVTLDGLKRADALTLGDMVRTEAGAALLTKVSYERYDGTVHNLKLGSSAERRLIGNEDTTFFANGILVGDGRLQAELEFSGPEFAGSRR